MNKNIIPLIIMIAVLLIGIGYMTMSKKTDTNTQITSADTQARNIVISEKNGDYYPKVITVKQNEPIRISLDSSVKGCLRSFTVRDFGINKYLASPSDSVTFTPDKKGTFVFACSMGMGTGKLVVE